jgi:hypothetical protein
MSDQPGEEITNVSSPKAMIPEQNTWYSRGESRRMRRNGPLSCSAQLGERRHVGAYAALCHMAGAV